MKDIHTERKMCDLAKLERRYDCQWGVVHGGHAACVAIFRTYKEAEKWRKENASAYVTVRVKISPIY